MLDCSLVIDDDEKKVLLHSIKRQPGSLVCKALDAHVLFITCISVTTIPGIWIYPGAVFPNFRDIQIPGLFDAFRITNSGILENHGIYIMLIFRMNSLMLHGI